LRIPRRQGHPTGQLAIETDLERILSRTGQRDVEYQDRSSFDVDHTGGRLPELDGAFAPEEFVAAFVDETDANGVDADLGAPTADPEHQVSARVYRGKVGQPDMLEHAEHAELSLLVDQGIIGDNRKIEMQLSGPVWT
jgi:hypothetical protein